MCHPPPPFAARKNQLFSVQTHGKYNLSPPANVRSASRNNYDKNIVEVLKKYYNSAVSTDTQIFRKQSIDF